MKHIFTLIFCALSLYCAAQVPQPLVNPGVYDISVFGPLGSNQAFRNKFTAVKIGSDTVWYFVDIYGARALMVAGASGGGSGDSTVNVLSPLAGNGTTLNPIRFINGSADGQFITWDTSMSNWVYQDKVNWGNLSTPAQDSAFNISLSTTPGNFGVLRVLDRGGYKTVPKVEISPIQSLNGSTGEIDINDDGLGNFDLTLGQQSATVGQALKWNGTKWTPGSAGGSVLANQGLGVSGDTVQYGQPYNGPYNVIQKDVAVVAHPLGGDWQGIRYSSGSGIIMGAAIDSAILTGNTLDASPDPSTGYLTISSLSITGQSVSETGDEYGIFSANGNGSIVTLAAGNTTRENAIYIVPDSTVFEQKGEYIGQALNRSRWTPNTLITKDFYFDSLPSGGFVRSGAGVQIVGDSVNLGYPGLVNQNPITDTRGVFFGSDFFGYGATAYLNTATGFGFQQVMAEDSSTLNSILDDAITTSDYTAITQDVSGLVIASKQGNFVTQNIYGGGVSISLGTPGDGVFNVSDETNNSYIRHDYQSTIINNQGWNGYGSLNIDSSGTSVLSSGPATPGGNGEIGFRPDLGGGVRVYLDSLPTPGQTLIAGNDQTFYFANPDTLNYLTYFAADAPLGFLEIGDKVDTLQIPILSIAPIQLLSSSDGSVDITPGLGGSFDLSVSGGGGGSVFANQGITKDVDTLKLGQAGYTPFSFGIRDGRVLSYRSGVTQFGATSYAGANDDGTTFQNTVGFDSTEVFRALDGRTFQGTQVWQNYDQARIMCRDRPNNSSYVVTYPSLSQMYAQSSGAAEIGQIDVSAAPGNTYTQLFSSRQTDNVNGTFGVFPQDTFLRGQITDGVESNTFLVKPDSATFAKKVVVEYTQTAPTQNELITGGYFSSLVPLGTFNADVLSYNPTTGSYLAVPANRSTVAYGGTSGTLTVGVSVTDLVGIPATSSTIKLNFTPDSNFNDPFTTIRYVHNWGPGTLTLDTDEAWTFSNRGAAGTATATLITGQSARLIWDSVGARFVYEIY